MDVNEATLFGVDSFSQATSKSLNDMFLQLLMTQLRMQSPLEPMDAGDMVGQIAQLSSLEQLTNLNTSFNMNLLLMQSLNNAMALALTGKVVRIEGNEIEYDGNNDVKLGFYVPQEGEITITIYDEDGKVVKRIELGKKTSGYHEIKWNGLDGSGKKVPAGKYTFQVVGKAEDGSVFDCKEMIQGVIEGLKFKEDGTPVFIVNGKEIGYSDITEIWLQETAESSGYSPDYSVYSLLGKIAHVKGNEFEYHGGTETLRFWTDRDGNFTVRIYDEEGNLVYEEGLGFMRAGYHEIEWRGIDEEGNLVSSGTYRFEIVGNADGEEFDCTEIIEGKIEGIRFNDYGEPVLIINGKEYYLSDIVEVWMPENTSESGAPSKAGLSAKHNPSRELIYQLLMSRLRLW